MARTAPRRVSLPAADDLFRPTGEGDAELVEATHVRVVPDAQAPEASGAEEEEAPSRRPSGRVRHDEKMTVYVTADELLDIERARLTLRGDHGLAVDRGRLVREALALVLADLDEQGLDSMLVRRLTQR